MGGTTETNTTHCPGCGLDLPDQEARPPDRYIASGECWQLYGKLTAYTISRGDRAFIHQHCVDTYGTQHSGEKTKPITTAFGLIGLYLFVEKQYSGRQVQQAHMVLADQDRNWPELTLPPSTGDITVRTVLDADTDEELELLIQEWAESVWAVWDHAHEWVRDVCSESLEVT